MKNSIISLEHYIKPYLFSPIPNQSETLSLFQKQINTYQSQINTAIENNEHEEHFKNLFNNFLKDIYSYDINTHKRIDCVIKEKGQLKVLIEVKRPQNLEEMIIDSNFNNKAFHELLLYYYEQRQELNSYINHLIITDCKSVYFFKSTEFEKLITNKKIVTLLSSYKNKELEIIKTTTDFYKEVSKLLESESIEISATKINLFDEGIHLEYVYRLFDKFNLFKKALENKDHNILDKDFYNELLYIMGLHETIDSGIPIIKPLTLDSTHNHSLMSMTINKIDHTKIDSTLWLSLGETQEERTESMALELVLTWINRILFLKLLEAQLIKYHTEDKEKYKFLDSKHLKDWDEVDTLFFDILAKPIHTRERKEIPYLNSSLFEPTSLEFYVAISKLNINNKLDICPKSVLKESKALNTLQYLLEFLDCYNFGTGDSNLSESKRLINASVLGLIFEKLNGYKDGAVYTPSFITMSMSREALQKTVVQKYNEHYDWNCQDLLDLKNKIIQLDIPLLEANSVFNTIRICDPAVGSGHFLVSILNELLLIKYELKILCDKQGHIISHCDMNIQYDELFIKYNGQDFNYQVNAKNKALNTEIQILQETLFHQKETLIENCLFGVDINPKSAYICQLRLWIELLKNTYYHQETTSNTPIVDLQTLPNIDINIKIGNSLVSRFGLKQDFSLILNALKGRGISMNRYKELVHLYKNAHNKEEKARASQEIALIKSTLKEKFLTNDIEYDKLVSKHKTAINNFETAEKDLFNVDQSKLDELSKKIKDTKDKLDKADDFYRHSMEWRYEFPEVLDDDGNFLGFDLIIGNPPYIQLQSMKTGARSLFPDLFTTYTSSGDIYQLFMEQAYNIMSKKGIVSFVISNKWMRAGYGAITRKWLYEYTHTHEVLDMGAGCFDNVTVDANIITYSRRDQLPPKTQIPSYIMDKNVKDIIAEKSLRPQLIIQSTQEGDSWIILSELEATILNKIKTIGKPLKDWDITINSGVKTGLNEAFIIDTEIKNQLIKDDPKSKEIIKPMLRGRDIKRYTYEFADKWLINTHNGVKSKNIDPIDINNYPAIKKHLDQYSTEITKRLDQGDTPYNLRACAYLEDFEKPKIIYQEITQELNFYYDESEFYTNNKCFIITHNTSNKKLYILLAILNSQIGHFWIRRNTVPLGNKGYELRAIFMENLPIPTATPEQQAPIIALAQACITTKEKDKNADISSLQNQIDKLVYALYGLSEEEISVVEGNK